MGRINRPTHAPAHIHRTTPLGFAFYAVVLVYLSTPSRAGSPPTATPTPTASATRTQTRTTSSTATGSSTQTRSRTGTPTPSSSGTRTRTDTRSRTPTPSRSRTPTASGSPSRTRTSTPAHTATPTRSHTPTPSRTQTRTRTSTRTRSVTDTHSKTPTHTPTFTVVPTWTATSTSTPTTLPTTTTTPTPTRSRSRTPTSEPTLSNNCGDNVRFGVEECDGTDVGGQTCQGLGFLSGSLGCLPNCTFNRTTCGTCGNSQVEGTEQCDGLATTSTTCVGFSSQLFSAGSLGCGTDCLFDFTGCTTCLSCISTLSCPSTTLILGQSMICKVTISGISVAAGAFKLSATNGDASSSYFPHDLVRELEFVVTPDATGTTTVTVEAPTNGTTATIGGTTAAISGSPLAIVVVADHTDCNQATSPSPCTPGSSLSGGVCTCSTGLTCSNGDCVESNTCTPIASSLTVSGTLEFTNCSSTSVQSIIVPDQATLSSAGSTTLTTELDFPLAGSAERRLLILNTPINLNGASDVDSKAHVTLCNSPLQVPSGSSINVQDYLHIQPCPQTPDPSTLTVNPGGCFHVRAGATSQVGVEFNAPGCITIGPNGALDLQAGGSLSGSVKTIGQDGSLILRGNPYTLTGPISGSTGNIWVPDTRLNTTGADARDVPALFGDESADATGGMAVLEGCGTFGPATFVANSLLALEASCSPRRSFAGDVTLRNSRLSVGSLNSLSDAGSVTGAFTLGEGNILEISSFDGFTPAPGINTTILTAGSITGTFSQFVCHSCPADVTPQIFYTANQIIMGFVSNIPTTPALPPPLDSNSLPFTPVPSPVILNEQTERGEVDDTSELGGSAVVGFAVGGGLLIYAAMIGVCLWYLKSRRESGYVDSSTMYWDEPGVAPPPPPPAAVLPPVAPYTVAQGTQYAPMATQFPQVSNSMSTATFAPNFSQAPPMYPSLQAAPYMYS